MSQESSAQENEPTALEYARDNGLSRDYLAEGLGSEVSLRLQGSLSASLTDSTSFPQFNLGFSPNVEERLTLSNDAALLLQSTIREETREDIDALISSIFNTKNRTRSQKLELPLLKSDHETDYRLFASRDGFDIKVQDVKLPLELVDDEKNEGFIFPAAFWNIGLEILQKMKTDKMKASKKTLIYMSDCVKPRWTEDDTQALWDSELKYKRNTALEPVTPPLSPAIAPIREPYEPSSSDSAYHIPLLSSPTSPTKQELEAIEKMISEKDLPTPLRNAKSKSGDPASDTISDDPVLKLSDIYTPLASLENTPPSLEVKRMRREDLKVEEPLTPDNFDITMPKTVRFSDIVEEMELDSDSRFSSPDGAKLLHDAFGNALRQVEQQAEQEKLIAADATARVDVPIIDFSKADPPWKKFETVQNSAKLASMQMELIRDVVGSILPKCVPVHHKDLKLQWTPFPNSLGKVVLEEVVPDDGHKVETFLKEVIDGDIIESLSLVWKPEGLKILKDEDDDEIDFGVFLRDNPQDLSSLVKKRKLELKEADAVGEERSLKKIQQSPVQSLKQVGSRQTQLRPGSRESGILLGGAFSVGNALNNFLELRGAKKAKLTDSNYLTVKPNTSKPIPQAIRTATPQMQIQIRNSPIPKAPHLPAPLLPEKPPATNVVVSSTVLKNRALVKSLERLLPDLKLIERDFTAHNATTWQPGTVTRSPIKSSLDSEADLIVSPLTGTIITTLQKIKQKPLPGQNTKPAIRDRIEKVSVRYEKLIILIAEGRGDETTNGLEESDSLSYSEFLGFISGFPTTITAYFIAGGEETLAKWLASTIIQHRVFDELELLTEETHWELFLRRAGLNAFAAQAVIAQLKAPDGVDPRSPSKAGTFGLTAFVEMGTEQRIMRFGGICGVGLMERVSAIVDATWE